MRCSCGDTMTIDARDRNEAVQKMRINVHTNFLIFKFS